MRSDFSYSQLPQSQCQGVAFSLGHTLMHNLGLYGALVTAGLMVPVFQTWFRVAKFANMFSGTVDTYVVWTCWFELPLMVDAHWLV
jgi:hypothetical protein